jgi:hypothetical protein
MLRWQPQLAAASSSPTPAPQYLQHHGRRW